MFSSNCQSLLPALDPNQMLCHSVRERRGKLNSLKFCKKQSKVIYFHPLSHNSITHSTHTFLLKTYTPEMDLIFHDIFVKVVFRSADHFNQQLLIRLRSIMSGLEEIDPFTVKALERIPKSFFKPCDLC